jgi:hypothetical protein
VCFLCLLAYWASCQIRYEIRRRSVRRIVRDVGRAARQCLCGLLRGHTERLTYTPDRMALRCPECGWTSPGWHVPDQRPAMVRPECWLQVQITTSYRDDLASRLVWQGEPPGQKVG